MPPPSSKSRSVLGATELTLLAPIRRGAIPGLESRSYVTRATVVLEALHALGISRREIDPTPFLVDVTDAIRSIRSFRLSVVGAGTPAPQLLLSVSFDGGWEPYIRKIHRDLGPLLDLIFINAEGYPLSWRSSFEEYVAWIRGVQQTTRFYYEACPITVGDMRTLRRQAGDVQPAVSHPPRSDIDQTRSAMVALHRLVDLYPPTGDGAGELTLRRAARLLLKSALDLDDSALGRHPTASERAAWAWLRTPTGPEKTCGREERVDRANVQRGILEKEPTLEHACLVLIEIDDAIGGLALLEAVAPYLHSDTDRAQRSGGPVFANIGLTPTGLEALGVDRGTIDSFPLEFREGMAARASILGDWLYNHPSNWRLPTVETAAGGGPLEVSRVGAVLKLCDIQSPRTATWQDMTSPSKVALQAAVTALRQALDSPGEGRARVLLVQPLQHLTDQGGVRSGHFVVADGLSQPGLAGSAPVKTDVVAPGDLLLGYRNGRGDAPARTGRLWKDSTFGVVRQLHQDVGAWRAIDAGDRVLAVGRRPNGDDLIQDEPDNEFDFKPDPEGKVCPLWSHVRRANPREERPDLKVPLRLVRRGMSYGPLLDDSGPDDERGLMFMAYNASIAEQFEAIQGWLAGGNSAGDRTFSGQRDPLLGVLTEGDPCVYRVDGREVFRLDPARPLVTLRWGLYCFMPSITAFAELRTIAADRADELHAEPPVPPVDRDTADRWRQDHRNDCVDRAAAEQALADRRRRETSRLAALGAGLIARLQAAETTLGVERAADEWKLALEDAGARQHELPQAIWTAVREVHGGLLRTPYGVLVGSKSLVDEVLRNTQGRYTATGYNERLAKSFGEVFLGRDDEGDGKPYREESRVPNRAVMSISRQQAFDATFVATAAALECQFSAADEEARAQGGGAAPAQPPLRQVELQDLIDTVLADLCTQWFGIPDGTYVQAGGWRWQSGGPPRCPGQFHTPSRYTFQPRPTPDVAETGQRHGKTLKRAVLSWIRDVGDDRAPKPGGVIGAALFDHIDPANQPELLATTLIGVMMGFLPTVDGSLRGVLFDWVGERRLWSLQGRLRCDAAPAPVTFEFAQRVLEPELRLALQRRPVPDLIWRMVKTPHEVGLGRSKLPLRAGDVIVLGLGSAMQEDQLQGLLDTYPMFGGNRSELPHPTHACPGHEMAFGVMLGLLSALMTGADLRPALSPTALRIARRSR